MKTDEWKEAISFSECQISTFNKLLKEMNFRKLKTREISRKILVEQPENRLKREEFLKKKAEILAEFQEIPISFCDETYTNRNFKPDRVLVDISNLPEAKLRIGKGKYNNSKCS